MSGPSNKEVYIVCFLSIKKELKTKNNRGKVMLFNARKPNTIFFQIRLTGIYAILLQSLVIALIRLYLHCTEKMFCGFEKVDRPATSEITSTCIYTTARKLHFMR